jgi:hypothetical protein
VKCPNCGKETTAEIDSIEPDIIRGKCAIIKITVANRCVCETVMFWTVYKTVEIP